jgi:putative oxidoreductase
MLNWRMCLYRLALSSPHGLQGIGLLILRIVAASGLVTEAVLWLQPPIAPGYAMLAVAEVLFIVLLILGLWTIAAAILTLLLQTAELLANHPAIELHLMRASLELCIALLGPGEWSLDARLFGRKRVEIRDLRDK